MIKLPELMFSVLREVRLLLRGLLGLTMARARRRTVTPRCNDDDPNELQMLSDPVMSSFSGASRIGGGQSQVERDQEVVQGLLLPSSHCR